MDDVLKRLGSVESEVTAIRVDVSAIKAIVPHLATEARLCAVEGSLNDRISRLESSLIKWIIGTVISSAALAFAIAKFVS